MSADAPAEKRKDPPQPQSQPQRQQQQQAGNANGVAASAGGRPSSYGDRRLRLNPNKDHKPEKYDDVQTEFDPCIFSSLERHLPPSMLEVPRDAKVQFMKEILARYLPDGERTRLVRRMMDAMDVIGVNVGHVYSAMWVLSYVVGIGLDRLELSRFGLAKYAAHLINTERMKAKRFLNGLKSQYITQLAPLEIQTYAEMVRKAQLLEDAMDFTDRIKGKFFKKEMTSGPASAKPTIGKKSPFNITEGSSQEWKPKADLVCMSMEGYDVILGADWLSTYGASVDCADNQKATPRYVAFWGLIATAFLSRPRRRQIEPSCQQVPCFQNPEFQNNQWMLTDITHQKLSTAKGQIPEYSSGWTSSCRQPTNGCRQPPVYVVNKNHSFPSQRGTDDGNHVCSAYLYSANPNVSDPDDTDDDAFLVLTLLVLVIVVSCRVSFSDVSMPVEGSVCNQLIVLSSTLSVGHHDLEGCKVGVSCLGHSGGGEDTRGTVARRLQFWLVVWHCFTWLTRLTEEQAYNDSQEVETPVSECRLAWKGDYVWYSMRLFSKEFLRVSGVVFQGEPPGGIEGCVVGHWHLRRPLWTIRQWQTVLSAAAVLSPTVQKRDSRQCAKESYSTAPTLSHTNPSLAVSIY
ncbi:hypothetical protein Taro_046420 [Colocasia esculenta]|uniref:Uncharacterized protein n=1 Tax=Colocasia esculenta TaxID=4460 RepID=A0A843X641_COLES|nr:hypothetical protein [Colocasia esculenta]